MSASTFTRRMTVAGDIMARNPLSISESTSVREAAAFLLAQRISAAPVINEAGRAVGVVSLTDIVRHTTDDSGTRLDLPVRGIMNDQVYFVRPGTPINQVIEDLINCDVKRLFVADDNEVLVGVISSSDLLRNGAHFKAAAADLKPAYVPRRRPVPSLPRRPSPFARTPPTGSDIVMAGR